MVINPLETMKTMEIVKLPCHGKSINVLIDALGSGDQSVLAVPSYDYLEEFKESNHSLTKQHQAKD